jgi:hypothetical protein
MQIRIQSTGAVVYEAEFRAMHPNTSFPPQLTTEMLASMGADPVLEGPQATTVAPYQYSQRSGVEQVGGQWFTKYIAGPVFTDRAATDDQPAATAAEQEAAYKASKDAEQATAVRATRTKLLADTDWTQVADAPVDKAVWAAHRQALRDVTAQAGFPWTITWPEQP